MGFDATTGRQTENDATSDLIIGIYKKELKASIDQNFPLIDSPETLKSFAAGQIPIASFNILDKRYRRNAAAAVFARAADPTDTVISAHGLKHDEALKATGVIAGAIIKGTAKISQREPSLSKQSDGSRYEFSAPGVFKMEFPEA